LSQGAANGKLVIEGDEMLDTPQIRQVEAMHTAVIRFIIPQAEIRQVMGAGFAEVREVLAAQGLTPSGPWFSHHLRLDPDIFDFEVGVPVSSPVAAAGRVVPGELPAATVAQAVMHGPYEELEDAWGKLQDWIADRGYTTAPDLWEYYVVGPESGLEASSWQTELNWPLAIRR
jgi:effector-binding domain-containing protein